MNKRGVRLLVGLLCTVVVTFALLWFVPPAPRLTEENIGKLHANTTEGEAIALFGQPVFKERLNDGGHDLRWVEDRVLFGVRLHEDGKVIGIRWEKDREPEDFWRKLRRRLRL